MTKPIIGIGSDVTSTPGTRDRAFAYTTYIEALRAAGAVPVVIPPQPENAESVVEGLDGIVLAGGFDCDPAAYGQEPHSSVEPMDLRRQENDLALARMARRRGIPTLGICLGVQVMNIAAGGNLIQDIDSEIKTDIQHASDPSARVRHDISLLGGTKLASILGSGELNVNSSHHQAIKSIGQGLRVTANAPDGIIEGVEDPQHPFYIGVQWHPEDMPGEQSAATLFAALVKAAREYARRKHSANELSPAADRRSE